MLSKEADVFNRITRADLIANPRMDIQGISWQSDFLRNQLLKYLETQVEPEFQELRTRRKYPINFKRSPTSFFTFNQFIKNDTLYSTHSQNRKNVAAISENLVAVTTEEGLMTMNTLNQTAKLIRRAEECESLYYCPKLNILSYIYKEDKVVFVNTTTGKDIATKSSDFSSNLANKARMLSERFPLYILIGNSRRYVLNDMLEDKTLTKYGFSSYINDIDVDEENQVAVVVGDETKVGVQDLKDPKNNLRMSGHYDHLYCVRFMDWPYVATAGGDISVRVWDLRKPDKSVHLLKGNSDAILNLEWCRNRKLLIAAERHSSVSVFDMRRPTVERWKELFFGEVTGTALSPSQEKLFVGINEGIGGVLEYGFNDRI